MVSEPAGVTSVQWPGPPAARAGVLVEAVAAAALAASKAVAVSMATLVLTVSVRMGIAQQPEPAKTSQHITAEK
jgi:hypothetical protein